jgi:GT2 family glycosyltransferase
MIASSYVPLYHCFKPPYLCNWLKGLPLWTVSSLADTIDFMRTNEALQEKQTSSFKPDVSVVVVNWNLKEYLRDCLNSLQQHSGDLTVETLVVDNGSTDGSIEMVKKEFPNVTLLCNAKNVGFSRASNQAIKKAGGRYLFLMNNDAILFKDALPRLVEFMDQNTDVGICGPKVINEDGTLQIYAKGYYPSLPRALGHFFLPPILHRCFRSLGFYEFQESIISKPIDWLSGCAILARREAVESVGMLNEKVFMYCEDVDWCYRMNRAGWKIYYVPSAVVMHYGGQSMKKQTGKVVGAHRAGLVAFYSQYHGSVASTVFRMVLLIGYAMQALRWVGSALFGRRAGLDKIRRRLRHSASVK